MPIDTTKTGAAIAAYRQRMNLSQQGLAGLMNVTHQAVSKWEKGLALPDTETLLALVKLFGTTMEDLLMGVLPKEPEPAAEEAAVLIEESFPEQQSPAEETAEPVYSAELEDLDFSSIMNMMPFVSTKVADQLFRTYAQTGKPDASKLLSIAPFVSTRVLAEYVSAHPFKDSSPELIASLAPFLPTKAVDDMILGMEKTIPPHVVQMLMPFASSKVVDQMVLGRLGIQWEEPDKDRPGGDLSAESNPQADSFGCQFHDKIHQKIQKKLDALNDKDSSHPCSSDAKRAAARPSCDRHESPRTRLIHKAIETGNYDIIENLFNELDSEAYHMLLSELAETGDAKLLELFCEFAGELDLNAQLGLVQILINGRMYNELAEIIDELEEDIQHHLIDKAFEINDSELLHLISEHL